MTSTLRHWLVGLDDSAASARARSEPRDFADTWADTQPGMFRSEAFAEDLEPVAAPAPVSFTAGHFCSPDLASGARLGG